MSDTDILDEWLSSRSMHDSPIIRLLPAHAEADDCFQCLDAETFCDQFVLSVNVILVAQAVVGGKGRVVGGRAGLAVSEHGDHDYMVGCQSPRGEVEGRVYAAAEAGRYEDGFGGGAVEGAVGDFHCGGVSRCFCGRRRLQAILDVSGREFEGWDGEVFDSSRVDFGGGHYGGNLGSTGVIEGFWG